MFLIGARLWRRYFDVFSLFLRLRNIFLSQPCSVSTSFLGFLNVRFILGVMRPALLVLDIAWTVNQTGLDDHYLCSALVHKSKLKAHYFPWIWNEELHDQQFSLHRLAQVKNIIHRTLIVSRNLKHMIHSTLYPLQEFVHIRVITNTDDSTRVFYLDMESTYLTSHQHTGKSR